MKVFQINTVCGKGSTGTICTDIALTLKEQGHDCRIGYGQGSTAFPDSYKIGTVLENHLHNGFSRLTGKQGYFSSAGTKRLIGEIELYKPDIIHLHNIHGNYLNFVILFKYLAAQNIPVVWTLHDCWAFTGKCAHYTAIKCYKWENKCYACPQVHTYPPSLFLDRSESSFIDKKLYFNSLKKLKIITVSKWLKSEVERSFLNRNEIINIYNWINSETFSPDVENVRPSFSNSDTEFIILAVSASWSKNDHRFKDLLKLSKKLGTDSKIIMVGKLDGIDNLPRNITHIPYVNGEMEMAKMYAMANVYVHLSIEDTFGKVIAEALSCGTPAIVYNSTACPEIVGEGCGYVVESGNISELLESIEKVRSLGKQFFSKTCREFVIKNFDKYIRIQDTINLYKRLLEA